MIVGTAGHVDHGKTALVRALTGVETDRLKEEKARGISIDLGFAYMPAGEGVIGFVDVPGHEKFVRNMLAGATGVDFVLLVVAADDGVMPQTIEHLAIVDLLGVGRGVVALTRVDLVSPERRAEATRDIRESLAGTSLGGAEIVEVSSVTGEGVEELRGKLLAAAEGIGPRMARGRFRLAVDRCFSLTGAGTIVTGAVLSGSVSVGDAVTISPSGLAARVRSIHAQNRAAKTGCAGERCALNLTGEGISKDAVARGDVALDPALHAPADRIDATLRVLASEPKPVSHWMPARLHHGAAEIAARVALLGDAPIRPGESGLVQIVLERPTAAAIGDAYVLRDTTGLRTIGGGRFIDMRAPGRKRRTPRRRALIAARALAAPGESFAALLDCWPFFVDPLAFARDHAMTDAEVETIEARAGATRAATADAAFCFSRSTWDKLKDGVGKALGAFHAATPEAPGIAVERLRLLVEPRLPAPVFACVLNALARTRDVAFEGGAVRAPGHRAGLTPKDGALWGRIAPLVSGDERFRPPRGREIADLLKTPEPDVRRVLKSLARQRALVEIAPDHYFSRAALGEIAGVVAEIAAGAADGHFSAAQLRDRLDNGRKVAIQILEYFDRQGVTVRRGDLRRVNPPKLDPFLREFT